MHIPQNIQRLFWEYDTENLDFLKSKKEILVKTLNYGNWQDWLWLRSNYSKEEVLTLIQSNRSGIRDESRKLAELVFH